MQGTMDNMQQAPWWTKMVVYWLENQAAITFYSPLPPTTDKEQIIASLHLDGLDKFLSMMGYQLLSFTERDVRHAMSAQAQSNGGSEDEGDPNLNSLRGKYIFLHPSGQGSLVKCFFHVKRTGPYAMTGSPVVHGMGMGGMMYGASGMNDTGSVVTAVVNLLNSNREELWQQANVSIVAASPNWLSGATPPGGGGGCTTHGCPLSPPVPVQTADPNWHITLPDLSPKLQDRTGAGVIVFVMDTSPSPEQIIKAAQKAGANNTLLRTIAAQIQEASSPKVEIRNPDLSLPWILEEPNPQQPATGRDVCGRLIGYDVTDHGLFVMGIIRDLAPAARIECVRVLNNFGVGTVSVLVEALEEIHNRMSPIDPTTGKAGDLYGKPVVINMSLVTIPHQEEMVQWWSMGAFSDQVRVTDQTEPLTHTLHTVIQSLTSLGAVIVSSAGNDSDVRQFQQFNHPKSVIVSTQRMKPRYPAAFPEVISVGAVDKYGHATLYSNDPVGAGSVQHNGIATYGGGVYVPVFPEGQPSDPPPPDCSPFNPNTMTGVDLSQIDALVGIYSSECYPALSADDVPSTYKAPNDNGWAYWAGTSFATPIVSAVATRLLEELATHALQPDQWHDAVMRAFTRASGQRELLTGNTPLPIQAEFSRDAGINIGLLNAKQAGTTETQKAEPHEEKAPA